MASGQREEPKAAHATSAEAVLAALGTSSHGLTTEDALARLVSHGPNSLPRARPPTAAAIFVQQFKSPLIYILIAAAIVAFALRYLADAAFIVVVLVLNAIIGTIQEYGAERSADALRKLVPERSFVLRGGERHEVESVELVPGDVVLLEAGAKVPADLRLLSATGLEVDESLLTGESAAAPKDATTTVPEEAGVADRMNMAFAGTMTVRGKAHGAVVATGSKTELGALSIALGASERGKPPLLQRMDRFAKRIAVAVGVSVLLVGAVATFRGMPVGQVFLVCVALAVSAIPEGLPVALTVALSIATRRMSKRNVIVRRLVAVEALGSCSFVASDKTGTLTMNELTVTRVTFPGERPWTVTGTGTRPDGNVEPEGDIGVGPAAMMAARLAETGVLCNDGFLGRRGDDWVHHGDAVDVALLAFGHKVGLLRAELEEQRPALGLIPFEAERRFAASLNRAGDHSVVHVKGAFERLIPMCSSMLARDGDVPIDAEAIQRQAAELAAVGYRVLGLASGPISVAPDESLGPHHLEGLVFLGLVAMIDPLRPEAKAAVASCRQAGVEVAMVTGDHPLTAFAIAEQLGMVESLAQVVTGADLHEAEVAGRQALDSLVQKARVFARVEPAQKLAIVQALTRLGHFVAVTGDGANDAPALRAAHVGVAMAKRGTDVAREAASLIVTDDNFASIVAGIEEGRIAYANVRKVVFLLVSTGATEVALFLVAVSMGLPPPLLPVQLLWLNLVTNGIQDVTLAFEPAEGSELRKPPRSTREPIFNQLMLERVAVTAVVMGLGGVLTFRSLLAAGWTTDAARNALLLLLVLFENFQVGVSRSETVSMFRLDPLRNPLLLGGTLLAFSIHVAAMLIPALATALRTQLVALEEWPRLVAVALLAPLALELHKAARGLLLRRGGAA
ncbi:MAG: HAD-IC family P-type ATPase [Polyangiaceae bacterium]|nr:HAD-IC family P-type ATPase [Polyangiaceae bacterium]